MKETEIMVTVGQVRTNFDEVKNYILETLEEYKNEVVTDDNVPAAKKTVAALRKEQKALKDEITERKSFYMRPWEEFMEQAKELIALYDEPINYINGQVFEYTERQRREKREQVEKIYEEIFEGMTEDWPFENIFEDKWLNVTCSIKQVRTDIGDRRNEIISDMQAMQAYNSDAVPEALERYKAGRSLADCIQYIIRYENQRAEILKAEEEKRRREEEERIRREERAKIEAEMKAQENLTQAVEQARNEAFEELTEALAVKEEDGAPAEDIIYSISLTAGQREALEIYMNSCGIEWEVIG